MRVLDVGSGMGEVALLAAEMVGPQGEVVGTDRVPEIVAAAAARLGAIHGNVRFVVDDPSKMAFEQPFDAVVGRYVLPYQSDLPATLRGLNEKSCPGGIMVFHEVDWGGARSMPPVSTYDQCCRWVAEGLRFGGAEPYTGSKLYAAFRRAGLESPSMRLEAIIGGLDDPSRAVKDLLETIFPASLIPTLVSHGVATAAEIDVDTLITRMRAEIRALYSVVVGRSEVGVWHRRLPNL
jgi:SAM-dependent methyltransferase